MKKGVIVAAVTGLLLSGALLLMYLIAAPQKAAAANLEAVNGITVGQTTEADLLRRPAFQKLERRCFEAECLYGMEAGNGFFSFIHLARRMHLSTVVIVRDGLVTRVSVILWRAGLPQLWLSQLTVLKDCDSDVCVKALTTPNKVRHGTSIVFNAHSEIRNHLPQAVNTTCFSRLQPCDTAELFPVFKQIGAQASVQ